MLKSITCEDSTNGVWAFTYESGHMSIVATGSSNRNVMQYNPNNGSPIFSCYAENSSVNNPIYLYEKVETASAQAVTVGPAGYATFVTDTYLMIPDDIEVFAVSINDAGTSAHLTAVTGGIRYGTAVLVKANEGTYDFPYADDVFDPISGNDLVAALQDVEADGTQYCLANKASGIGFYQVQAGVVIPAGKAYLVVQAPANGEVKSFYGFEEDDATSIQTIDNGQRTTDGIYNLAGQRLQKMQKGINIVNGKKILK